MSINVDFANLGQVQGIILPWVEFFPIKNISGLTNAPQRLLFILRFFPGNTAPLLLVQIPDIVLILPDKTFGIAHNLHQLIQALRLRPIPRLRLNITITNQRLNTLIELQILNSQYLAEE